MGNFASKEGQVPTGGAPLDLLHSLPTSQLTSNFQGTSLPPASAPGKLDGSKAGAASGLHKERGPPFRNSSLTLTPERSAPPDQTGSVAGGHGACEGNPSAPPPRGSMVSTTPPSEPSRPEGPPGTEDRRAYRDALALRTLLADCRTSLGLIPDEGDDEEGAQAAADLLRCVLAEREELVKEIRSLKETLRTERAEWLQFQSDLQVAVSVADRLHLEAQEELAKLRRAQEETEQRLAATRERRLEADRELKTSRAEHEETRRSLNVVRAELERLREGERARAGQVTVTAGEGDRDRGESREGSGAQESDSGEGPVAQGTQAEGKDLAGGCLQSTAAEEKREEEGADSTKGSRPTERSRSLSRLPLLSSTPSAVNGISQPTTSPRPLRKNQNTARGKRLDLALEGQESGSTGQQEELSPPNKHNATPTDTPHTVSSTAKAQDSFSLLLRRHGGSKRNSLLRWCQSRTQGYKNIEITNFSSSWSDGLAFCAVYHTYLPSVIPYSSLYPADRKENLGLAFRTGESVGILASLTVEEVLRRGGPDWQRVLGYVESMYRHFEM